jgi:DNA-binding HxlR family transcriptional regulator
MGIQGDPRPCSIANALEVIGEKWSLLTLREVFFGVHRFDQIAMNTGASRDLLTVRLNKLVNAGVLKKVKYNDRPIRYEYHLTPAGQDLQDVLLTLMAWGDKHVTQGRAPTVWMHSCGKRFSPRLTCDECSGAAEPETLTLWPRSPSVKAVEKRVS